MAVIKLQYTYYVSKPFNKKSRREGIFDFDTDIYWDKEDNYWNVVSDYIHDQGEIHMGLHVEKI